MRFYALALIALSAISGTSAISLAAERARVGKHLGMLPIFNYSTDRGLSLGLMGQLFDYGSGGVRPFETLTSAEAQYATRGARVVYGAFEKTGVAGDLRLLSEVYGAANSFQPYYGLGDSTSFDRALSDADAYFYNHREFGFVGSLRKRTPSGWDLRAGLGVSYQSSQSNSSETLYASEFGSEPRSGYYTELIAGAVLEERDFEFIPSEGRYASVSVSASPGILGNFESWVRADGDYRRYDSLIPNCWLWFATQARFSVGSSSSPFTEKPRLGSWGTLRGYPVGRFVSNVAVSLRSEVRSLPIRWNAFGYPLKGGAGVFLDTGQIADALPRLFQNPVRWAWGVTLFGSYFTDDFLGSADFGFSKEGSAVYLRLGHAI